jgi:membrane-bound lytic murein transglycosylase D
MFEEARQRKCTIEIKYLSIVESALNPKAVLEWELLDFGSLCIKLESNIILKIDSYVDERSDPLKSTAAAAKYMSICILFFETGN